MDLPTIAIIDAHHHLEPAGNANVTLEHFMADIGCLEIVATIYIESRAMMHTDGPEALRPVGETAFAAAVAAASEANTSGAVKVCAAIVSYADLRNGAGVGEVLDAHKAASGGRFRGIREVGLHVADDAIMALLKPSSRMPKGLFRDPAFRNGFAALQTRDLTFDAIVFHPQLADVAELAAEFPGTRIVLNHMGFPLGVGSFAGQRDEVWKTWQSSMCDLASQKNVFVKIGGMGMPFWGFEIAEREKNDAAMLARLWRPHVEATIDIFGPDRCMFESNFPPDGKRVGYRAVWDAFKIITAGLPSAAIAALFRETAREVYAI